MDKKQRSSMRYPDELKDRAVRMVQELSEQDRDDHGVIARVSRQLGVGDQSLRNWVKQAEINGGRRAGFSTAEHEELKQLRKENRELKRANDILQAAATFFGAELDRRPRR
jgi:transposase